MPREMTAMGLLCNLYLSQPTCSVRQSADWDHSWQHLCPSAANVGALIAAWMQCGTWRQLSTRCLVAAHSACLVCGMCGCMQDAVDISKPADGIPTFGSVPPDESRVSVGTREGWHKRHNCSRRFRQDKDIPTSAVSLTRLVVVGAYTVHKRWPAREATLLPCGYCLPKGALWTCCTCQVLGGPHECLERHPAIGADCPHQAAVRCLFG